MSVVRKLRKNKILFSCIIILLLFSVYFIYKILTPTPKLTKDNVFVSNNKAVLSEFDKWVINDVGVKAVPSFIVIKNNKVVGFISDVKSEEEFTKKLNHLEKPEKSKLPKEKITNLNNKQFELKELLKKKKITIIEIHMDDCKYCDQLDKNTTSSIKKKYKKVNWLRYYISSDKKKVSKKY